MLNFFNKNILARLVKKKFGMIYRPTDLQAVGNYFEELGRRDLECAVRPVLDRFLGLLPYAQGSVLDMKRSFVKLKQYPNKVHEKLEFFFNVHTHFLVLSYAGMGNPIAISLSLTANGEGGVEQLISSFLNSTQLGGKKELKLKVGTPLREDCEFIYLQETSTMLNKE